MNRILTLSCLLLAACGDKDDEDSGSDAFVPEEGDWVNVSETVLSDSCGLPDSGEDDGPAVLTVTGDDTFTLTLDDTDFTVDIPCTLDGKDAECGPALAFEQDFSSSGIDGVLTLHFSMSGSFSSTTAATFEVTASVDCAGTQCDDISAGAGFPIPCETVSELEVEHQP